MNAREQMKAELRAVQPTQQQALVRRNSEASAGPNGGGSTQLLVRRPSAERSLVRSPSPKTPTLTQPSLVVESVTAVAGAPNGSSVQAGAQVLVKQRTQGKVGLPAHAANRQRKTSHQRAQSANGHGGDGGEGGDGGADGGGNPAVAGGRRPASQPRTEEFTSAAAAAAACVSSATPGAAGSSAVGGFAEEVPGKYEVVKTLGRGTFGSVLMVRCAADNKLYAMKTTQFNVAGNAELARSAAHEVLMLTTVGVHPNIVAFRECFLARAGRVLCIVTALCESGTLKSVLARARESGARVKEVMATGWFVQAALALHHLHSHKALHRDLKPANIFLSQNRRLLKLGDLGLSTVLESTTAVAMTDVGTPQFCAPEIMRNRPYSHPADMWALGCVMCEVCVLSCS